MSTSDYNIYQREKEGVINLNPLQRGGLIPEEVYRTVCERGWLHGYSVCDHCKGCLDKIEKPRVKTFIHEDLPSFIGADEARVTHGAREGKFLVMHAVCKPGDTIVVDGNAHYSSIVAAERAGLEIVKTPVSPGPEYRVDPDEYLRLLEEKKPSLALLTHVDGNYGNIPDVKKIARGCKSLGVPVLLNSAYGIGRMPVDMKKLGVDFVVGSGHKSMASAGPIGVVGTTSEWAQKLFRKSPRYENKEVELLGCSSRGVPLVTLMLSFGHVRERVKHWREEVEKARWFSREMESLGGITQAGDKPHNHDLMFFETPVFYEISKKHKKKAFFLAHELSKRGITGIKPGLTRNFKLSTYLLSREELSRVIEAFREIASMEG